MVKETYKGQVFDIKNKTFINFALEIRKLIKVTQQTIMTADINTLTYDSFIQKIKATKVYRSNANKEYKVMKANKTYVVLRDQRTKTDYQVPAIQILLAMGDLGIESCTVTNMRAYVGTYAAPASAALIYWVFGHGTDHAKVKEIADLVFKLIKEEKKK